ncbi:DUF317 domain-containing protein [Streptomyces seoulensis]|uniref:DUF317 domain-containing protein n=1 Tax=Streptomyces seoulensis TaxID=73044 RepID=UPI001FCA8E78|nr:DUF317 domain-containing protein [Streptomyces seoulensis]BDH07233.1 hypothetical protein HEK131_44600 [Streptomyces seoulensis]
MPASPLDAHVRFDTHPLHTSAVTATVTGSQHTLARALLTARGFEPVDDHTLVMARIDREEPFWAERAAGALTGEGIVTEITPALRAAIDEEWTWPAYPMSWCTRTEIREVSDAANRIYEDIRHGRLVVHAHADDGWTKVAVGTYRDTSKSVLLHGENHLRQIEADYDSPAKALTDFARHHGARMRPGPAPATDAELQAAEARTCLGTPAATPEPTGLRAETVPAYAANPGDHDALTDAFLAEHGDWEKWRTWDDATTHLFAEDHTLRIEQVHEPHPRETAWTVAAYETPVSDRLWHLTATGATPAPILQALLITLGSGEIGDPVAGPPTEKAVAEATRPLADAGWQHSVVGRSMRWQTPGGAGVQFDSVAAQRPHGTLSAWTLWAGPSPDQATWTIHASPSTPTALLADLGEELAHGTGRRTQPSPRAAPRLAAAPATRPAPPAPPQTGRTR